MSLTDAQLGSQFRALVKAAYGVTTVEPAPPTTGLKTGLIIPAYIYPSAGSAAFKRICDAKKANPKVEIVAVLNPNNGVGSSVNSDYTTLIYELDAAGVKSIGYISTRYTGRPLAEVKGEIDRWKTFYPNIDGIFFDEQSNQNITSHLDYYKQASAYAKSKTGFVFTVGNPGANTLTSYSSTVDAVLIYESPGLPSLTGYDAWKPLRDKAGMIPFAVNTLPETWIRSASAYAKWIFVTSDVLQNPWDSLPSYFEGMVKLLNDLSP
jgi:hypothetical protein